jgi:hypothetical protein
MLLDNSPSAGNACFSVATTSMMDVWISCCQGSRPSTCRCIDSVGLPRARSRISVAALTPDGGHGRIELSLGGYLDQGADGLISLGAEQVVGLEVLPAY